MDDKALVPFSDMEKMAAVMAKTEMFGKNASQLLALMLVAQAEGIHPARAAQEYDVIQGRPALRAQAALGRFQETGGHIKWLKRSETEAEAEFTHPRGDSVTARWDIDKAKKRGLADRPNWKSMPGVMLMWRTISEGIRFCYPSCLNRMYIEYEVEDMDEMKPAVPEDIIEMQKVTDSEGNFSPPLQIEGRGEKGDGMATKLIELRTEFYSIINSSVFTSTERQNAHSKIHPGGRDLVPADSDIAILSDIIAEYKDIRDTRTGAKELDDGFNLALDKAD